MGAPTGGGRGLIVPDACVRYIRWQRLPGVEDVKLRYAEWVAEDFASIEPYLPKRVNSILDIGCGMAGIDVFLKRRYPKASLSLLDGNGSNVIRKGTPNESGMGKWHQKLKPYSSRKHAEMLLSANGIAVDRWHNIGTKKTLEADLIVSLYSLGFHYPLSTYRLKGLCIADLRREREPVRGEVIASGPKHDRCLFRCK